MSGPKSISILGSTGSIGTQTLDIVRANSNSFSVHSLTANTNVDLMKEQILEFKPQIVVMSDQVAAEQLKQLTEISCEIVSGNESIDSIVASPDVEIVMVALVGFAGLQPSLVALENGKSVALANKESLVAGGNLIKRALSSGAGALIPVDSEHNSIYQCLEARSEDVRRVIITASGGPFLHHSAEDLKRVTPEQAVKHPNWSMGAKISVDSATLMNKGLEVIEAAVLFDLDPSQVEVLVHPQSLVHAFVEYNDASCFSVMYEPDMKVPITHALNSLANLESSLVSGSTPIDFSGGRTLEFLAPDFERFPCLRLAFEALKAGKGAPLVLNAANEVAVESFLAGGTSFNSIPVLVEAVVAEYDGWELNSLEQILSLDLWARKRARALLNTNL